MSSEALTVDVPPLCKSERAHVAVNGTAKPSSALPESPTVCLSLTVRHRDSEMLALRASVAATACACMSVAFGVERPVTRVISGASGFSTLNGAAVAALAVALSVSARYEYGGVLLACQGRHFATAPVTTFQERRVDFTAEIPVGCTLEGLYHTHPGPGLEAAHFPGTDIAQAQALGVPSYIVVAEDGRIHVYDPRSIDASAVHGRSSASRSFRGKFVTRISPQGCRRHCADGLGEVRRTL